MSLRPTTRTEVRKKAYKTGVDAEEARRRREDNLVEIRKNKREDNLLKKRREALLQSAAATTAAQVGPPAGMEKKVCPFITRSFLSFEFFFCLLHFLLDS